MKAVQHPAIKGNSRSRKGRNNKALEKIKTRLNNNPREMLGIVGLMAGSVFAPEIFKTIVRSPIRECAYCKEGWPKRNGDHRKRFNGMRRAMVRPCVARPKSRGEVLEIDGYKLRTNGGNVELLMSVDGVWHLAEIFYVGSNADSIDVTAYPQHVLDMPIVDDPDSDAPPHPMLATTKRRKKR